MRQLTLCFALWLPAASCWADKIEGVASHMLRGPADAYIGEQYRAEVTRSMLAARKGDTRAAWAALQAPLAFCDQQKSTDQLRVYSVNNDAEAKEYRDAEPGVTTTFVDQACPAAYKAAAFLAVGANDADAAFAYLDREQALLPHWAEPLAERAYLVGKLGDRAKSLLIYQEAMALAEKYPSSAYLKPLILRGIGFALIELDRLDEAEQAFNDSLKLEPGNDLANNELRYIEQLRWAKAKSSTATSK